MKREERQKLKRQELGKEQAELMALRIRQQVEMEELKAMHKERRRKLAPTKAGGARAGAGRKPVLPHKPNIVDNEDLNKRRTMTLYCNGDEREKCKCFLRTIRQIQACTDFEVLSNLLMQIDGFSMFELMSSGTIGTNPQHLKLVKSVMPSLLMAGGADDGQGQSDTDEQANKGRTKGHSDNGGQSIGQG